MLFCEFSALLVAQSMVVVQWRSQTIDIILEGDRMYMNN